jgi:hypothetical protein
MGSSNPWWTAFGLHHGCFTYFDPVEECGEAVYPYQLTDFEVCLYDGEPVGECWASAVYFDIIVFEVSPSGNPCDGPGAEICRMPAAAVDRVDCFLCGTITLDFPCCVEGPVFIGILYTSGTRSGVPSLLFDDNTAPDSCDNWYFNFFDSLHHEWYDWWPLYEPEVKGYPIFGIYGETESTICTGEECDCIPGDANNDSQINVGDAVYLIAYVFKGGPPPHPYALCSGDANTDCSCNVGDAVFLINYVFKGGPAPVDCPAWLTACGLPLRK